MLVLTRKTDEAISIGDSICVRVLEVRGNKVRLGIEAPANVRIERHELRDREAFDCRELELEFPVNASSLRPQETRLPQTAVSRRAGTARPPARA